MHHEILLPRGADKKFGDASVLWNAVELKETRKNSCLAKEMVIALPDNPELSLSDKIQLTRGFIQKHFVEKGVAVQVDIHSPHNDKEHNWHAHVLIATRRFSENGKAFGQKTRDLDGEVRKRKLIEAERWGKLWRDHQNAFFKDKGLDFRVDPTGIIPQEHLGPTRMRARAFDLLNEHSERQTANFTHAHNPASFLVNKLCFSVSFSRISAGL